MPDSFRYIVAAFDFDGTITRRDSMLAFIRFVRGDLVFWGGMCVLLPVLIPFKLKLISEKRAKEIMLTFFLGGMHSQTLWEKGAQFADEKIPAIVRPAALARIRWHQAEGHMCFLVTASLTFWVRAWAEKEGFILIATKPEISGGIFTGKISGANCKGMEKVHRLEEILAGTSPSKKYAYGDTSGDKPMLQWADEGFYRHFS
ncbi:MAG: HAD family hydrolase [Bacteroidia bacterium]